MYLFQPTSEPSHLFFLAMTIVIGLAVWRVVIDYKVKKEKKKRQESNVVSRDSRRMIIELLDIDEAYFENPIRRRLESSQSPFWTGLLSILFGGRSVGCLGLSLVLITISVIISWMLIGSNSILGTLKIISSKLLFFFLFFIGLQVIVFLYYYFAKSDFRHLIEGIFHKRLDHKNKINAFQRAIQIFPSEYAYANLAYQHKRLAEQTDIRIDKYWSGVDYSQSIQYYYKASSLSPNRKKLIEERISLKKKMKDYEGALEDFYLIKDIEEKNKSKSIYARNDVLGTILYQWGADLTYAGEYDLALEKFDQSLRVLKECTDDRAYHRLRLLYRSRANCYYRTNQNDLAIRDYYEFVNNFISMCEDDLNEVRKEMGDRIGKNIHRWRKQLAEELEIIYPTFQALEDIEGAIRFLQDFYYKKDQVGYPIFAKHLLKLLVDYGKISKAKRIYTEYLNSGFAKDQWFEKWLSNSFSSEEQFWKKMKESDAAENPQLLFVYAFQGGRADFAKRYLEEALNDGPDQTVLYTAGMMLERQWNYSKALDYYCEYFRLMGGDYSDEKIIGRIKKNQRKLEEAQDCFEGIIFEFKEKGKTPNEDDIINLVQIKDELGDYWGGLQLLIDYDLIFMRKADGSRSNEYYIELMEKKVAKDRILNS